MAAPYSQISLGTAQFGFDYGISNVRGKIAESQVQEILDCAWNAGVRALDTARLYGDSEAVLGRAFTSEHNFRVTTKTPVINKKSITEEDAAVFRGAIDDSLNLLGLESLHGLMVHHSANLTLPGGQHLIRILQGAKAEMLVERIGVSVYSGDEIDATLEQFTPDFIQLPFSAADQRLVKSGHLTKLKNLGVEIQARSLFLQGVLLQDPDDLPEFFAPIRGDLEQFGKTAKDHGLTKLEACFAAALARPELDTIIVGITSISELDEILEAIDLVGSMAIERPPQVEMDHQFINPSEWPRQL